MQLLSAARRSRLTGVTSFNLNSPPPLFQVPGSGLLGDVADLDVVHDFLGASGLGHAGGGAFVLDHIGGSLPIGDASLHPNRESVFSDDRFSEARSNVRLDLDILCGPGGLRSGGALGRRGRFGHSSGFRLRGTR